MKRGIRQLAQMLEYTEAGNSAQLAMSALQQGVGPTT
jgi:hypothetical protein